MFESYVEGSPAQGRRRSLALASVGAHIAVGVALFFYSLLHIEEIAPPVVNLTFFSAPPPPPPPPPPPAGSSKPKTTPKVEPKTESKLVQPTEVKEKPKPEPEGGGVPGGVPGGVKGGVVGGVVGGVLGSTGPVGGAPPKMVASFTLAAQQLQHAEPRLPEWFKNQHAAETIKATYKVCIRQDGGISDVTPMNGVPAVDDGIIAHIKSNWLYKPQPVPVCTVSVIIFKIK